MLVYNREMKGVIKMSFIKKSLTTDALVDTVFTIVKKALADIQENGKENVINATVGSLFDENNQFVAYDNVFKHYNELDNAAKGRYAESFLGNKNYREDVFNWVFQGQQTSLFHNQIATLGGTGAVSMSITNTLEPNETLLIPSIAWPSYAIMAKHHNINVETYEMFDNDHFNLASLRNKIEKIAQQQQTICLIINDPCHNPCGYSMTYQEWEEVIACLNSYPKHQVVLINDIAYLDYSYRADARKYLQVFNQIKEHILVNIAFSTSKTMTSYGIRLGALISLCKNPEQLQEVVNVYEKYARAIFSNAPNGAMVNFHWVVNDNKEQFLLEKKKYVDLLAQRSQIFLKDAKNCGLAIYPYKDGFFITVKCKDNQQRDLWHENLMENHIYTVKVNLGIRIAICSLSVVQCQNLANKIKDLQPKD